MVVEGLSRAQLNRGLTHFVAHVRCVHDVTGVARTGMIRMRFAMPGDAMGIDAIEGADAFHVTWVLPRARDMVGYAVQDGPGDTITLYWRSLQFQRCKFLKEAGAHHAHKYRIGTVTINSELEVNPGRTWGVWALNVPVALKDRAVALHHALEGARAGRRHGAPVVQ